SLQSYLGVPNEFSAKQKGMGSILNDVPEESKQTSSSGHHCLQRTLSADMASRGWMSAENPLKKSCFFNMVSCKSDPSESHSFSDSSQSHSSPLLSHADPSFKYFVPTTEYDVFINHRGKDTKQSVASLIYHNLHNKRCKVFLDIKSIQVGDSTAESIKHAIRTASVHVVILSPKYAESEWCLDELLLILESRAPMVPVFWEIKPSVVRMEDEDGVYARTFQIHYKAGKFNSLVLEKWKMALRTVALIEGFIYEG
ncbi:hypothetical protein KI387_027763, partial [Taxus chinensis]